MNKKIIFGMLVLVSLSNVFCQYEELHWWKNNEGTGTTINDYGKIDYDATGVSGSWTTGGKVWDDIYTTLVDGTNDYIDTEKTCNELGMNTDEDWSLSLWAKNIDDSTTEDVLGSWYFERGGIFIEYNTNNEVKVRYSSDDDDGSANGRIQPETTGTVTAGQWGHIVLTFDNANRNLTIYLDGDYEVSAQFDVGENTAFGDDTGDVVIGNSRNGGSTSANANSLVDDGRLFDFILSSDQIGYINGGGSGNVSGLDPVPFVFEGDLFFFDNSSTHLIEHDNNATILITTYDVGNYTGTDTFDEQNATTENPVNSTYFDWTFYEFPEFDTYVAINETYDGHDSVLHIYDNNDTEFLGGPTSNAFAYLNNPFSIGTIEFWLAMPDFETGTMHLTMGQEVLTEIAWGGVNINSSHISVFTCGELISCTEVNSFMFIENDNEWNHYRFDINESAGVDGNGTTAFYFNGVYQNTFEAISPLASVVDIIFMGGLLTPEAEMYLDALSYTEDVNYDIGDNWNLYQINTTVTVNQTDLGLNQNITSGTEFDVTLNNNTVWNYSFLFFNPLDSSNNITYNFYSVYSNISHIFNNATNNINNNITINRSDAFSYPYNVSYSNFYWNNTLTSTTGSNPYYTTIENISIGTALNNSVYMNSTFLWNYNGDSLNITQVDEHWIFNFAIDDCSTYNTPFLNLSGRNEITRDPIPIDIRINFEFNDVVVYNTTDTGEYNYTFCFYPNNYNFTIDSEISYDGSPAGYDEFRNYFINDYNINNITNQVYLYVLEDNRSELLEFTVIDDVGIGLNDYTVFFNRWDEGTSSYSAVTNTITNQNGDGSVYIEFYNVWYQVQIVDDDNIIVKTFSKQKFTSSPVNFPITTAEGVEYNYLQDCHSNNVYWINDTRLVTEVVDVCGVSTGINMIVKEQGILQDTILCNKTLTGSSSFTTYCDIPINATIVSTYVESLIDESWIVIYDYIWDFSVFTDNYYGNGLFISFIIIGSLSAIGCVVSGSIGGLMSIVGIIICYLLGFIGFNWVVLTSLIALFIIVGMILRR